MKVVLTGASGLLGPALAASLRADGHDVAPARTPGAAGRADEARWDPAAGTVDPAALDGCRRRRPPGRGRARPTGRGRRRTSGRSWTAGCRAPRTIAARRGRSTACRRLVSTSGVGYYGNPGDTVLRRGLAPRDDLRRGHRGGLGGRDRARRRRPVSRVVLARTGWCSRPRAAPTGRCCRCSGSGSAASSAPGGSGGPGSRWTTTCRAVRFVLDHDDLAGPVNVSAPEPLTNAEMTAAMGRVLHRPTLFTAPGLGAEAAAARLRHRPARRSARRAPPAAGRRLRVRAPHLRARAARGVGPGSPPHHVVDQPSVPGAGEHDGPRPDPAPRPLGHDSATGVDQPVRRHHVGDRQAHPVRARAVRRA